MTGPLPINSMQFQSFLRNTLRVNSNLLKKSHENYTDACITSMEMRTPKGRYKWHLCSIYLSLLDPRFTHRADKSGLHVVR